MSSEPLLASLQDGFMQLLGDYRRVSSKCQSLEQALQAAQQELHLLRLTTDSKPSDDNPAAGFEPSDPVDCTAEDDDNIVGWWTNHVANIEPCKLARIRRAIEASSLLREGNLRPAMHDTNPLPVGLNTTNIMPSISESPLEQDFTTAGTPSRLDCPFNSLSKRRLSSHAASVVARYRPNGSITPRRTSVTRIDGGSSSIAQSSMSVKDQDGGICGALESPLKLQGSVQEAAGLCPIRFLEKNTAEEVAAYFEQHKHEVPRSHEVCVKRYQGDAKSAQEIDEKYGNLVSMIKGLGQKHVPLLPGKIDGDVDDEPHDKEVEERVRNWSQAIDPDEAGHAMEVNDDAPEERTSRFDRPMQDVRVGESPSRPWGIHVPVTAAIPGTGDAPADSSVTLNEDKDKDQLKEQVQSSVARPSACPFGYGSTAPTSNKPAFLTADKKQCRADTSDPKEALPHDTKWSKPVYVAPRGTDQEGSAMAGMLSNSTFNGPVFFGYTPEQAVAVLQALRS